MLARLRVVLGHTQGDLALRAAVTVRTIRRWERASRITARAGRDLYLGLLVELDSHRKRTSVSAFGKKPSR